MQKKKTKQDRTGLAHGEQSLPAMTHWAGASVGRHALPALANVYRTQSLVLGGGRESKICVINGTRRVPKVNKNKQK